MSHYKFRCMHCKSHNTKIVDSGESYDGGDDWYDYVCLDCGHHGRKWIEYD